MGNCHVFVFLLLASCVSADTIPGMEYLDTLYLRWYDRDGSHRNIYLSNANQLVPKLHFDEMLTIYIHGAGESVDMEGAIVMTNSLLNYTNANVLALDYRNISRLTYPYDARLCEHMGKRLAMVLEKWVQSGVRPDKIHIIGHSLGAQIAGFTGRSLSFKISRITGLDPAGPLFYLLLDHLTAADAEFVDQIHTDGGIYGLPFSTGSVDFYPNFGHRPQPGCRLLGQLLSPEDLCSHSRSWRYYAESIRNKEAFIGVKCPNSLLYILGFCNRNDQVIVGYYTPRVAQGSVYLTTNWKLPFGLGKEGALFSFSKLDEVVSNFVNAIRLSL